MAWPGQQRGEVISQKLPRIFRGTGNWDLRHFEATWAAFWKGKFTYPNPKSLFPETFVSLVMEISCVQTTMGIFLIFLNQETEEQEACAFHQNVAPKRHLHYPLFPPL